MRRRTALLCCLAAVLVAGCSGAFAPDEPETLTPAPVPTPTPTFTAGIGPDSVDPQRVAGRHGRRLDGVSYTLAAHRRISEDGTLLRSTEIRQAVASDGSRRRTVDRHTVAYPVGRAVTYFEYFRNQSFQAVQIKSDNSTVFLTGPQVSAGFSFDPAEREPVIRYLQSFRGTLRTSRPTDSGTAIRGGGIRLVGTMPLPISIHDPTNGSLRMRVGPTGVVRSVNVTYHGTLQANRTVRVTHEIRVSEIGETTVEPPAWVEEG